MNNPILCVQDNFFDDGHTVAEYFYRHGRFHDYQLGLDGVTYPHICTNIPRGIEYEFLFKLERQLGARVVPEYLFARAMPEGCIAPAKVHSDRDMGKFTAHVYLSSGDASTSFIRHIDLGYSALPEYSGSEWDSDPKDSAWQKYITVYGRQNRLLVHHAAHFHCAEPESGFGTLSVDARMVLTCFFNVI